MRFSVVICNYNYGRFVGEAIRSCLEQDLPSEQVEVIVVDDGSVDDSRAAIEAFAGISRVRAIFQPNRGQTAALAAGVAVSHGEFVCLLDADDFFHQHKLSRLDEHLRRLEPVPPAFFLCHDIQLFDHSAGVSTSQTWFDVVGLTGAPAQYSLEQASQQFPFAIPCGQVLSRELAVRIFSGLSSDDWRSAADSPIAHCALLAAGVVHYLHEPLAYYRIHASNDLATLENGLYRPKANWLARVPSLVRHLESFIDTLSLDVLERAARIAYLKGKERHLSVTSPGRHLRLPLLTIVLDASERPTGLRRSLSSIAAQTHPRIEVLLAGENPDLALPALDSSFPHPVCTVEAVDGLGYGSVGFRRAQGQFIMFIEAGVALDPGFAETHLRAHQYQRMVVLTSSDARYVDAAGTVLRPSLFPSGNTGQSFIRYLAPFSDRLAAQAFRPLTTTVFRRSRVLDMILDKAVSNELPAAAHWSWLLQQFARLLTGTLVLGECLADFERDSHKASLPSIVNARVTFDCPNSDEAAATGVWSIYCTCCSDLRHYLPREWHRQFALWIANELPRDRMSQIASAAQTHEALDLVDKLRR